MEDKKYINTEKCISTVAMPDNFGTFREKTKEKTPFILRFNVTEETFNLVTKKLKKSEEFDIRIPGDN
jgi:hypothetical protein